MKRYLGILIVITLCAFCHQANAQNEQRIIKQIQNGQMQNAFVTVSGYVERWEEGKAENTIAYVLRDNWGDKITVISNAEQPNTNERYQVQGYVAYEQANQEYVIMENSRRSLAPTPVQPPTATPTPYRPPTPTMEPAPVFQPSPTPIPAPVDDTSGGSTEESESTESNGYLIVLIIVILIVLVLLIAILLKGNKDQGLGDFDSTSVVTMSDKTQKITAHMPTEKAIQSGTVKVMPGWFEVIGGVELKEIRLMRPSGISEDQLEFTFGRKPGDTITHIQLNDPTVSSNQAKLQYKDNQFILINIPDPNDPDRNSTLLNGESMNANEERVIQEGDTIEMGHVKLVFHEKQ